ncbi:hypothetical protein Q5P01_000126 [Channa striata]|uniref:Uncharacterized protein n=1 Tax=Channa striata TaxID=64152 RepID=A0AA88IHP8_CHASR|nr:hypothetical protein Q5P01_000126 [Channa striata]
MNGAVRRGISPSPDCASVAVRVPDSRGAPATGLLQGGAFIGGAVGLQKSLELIRDMWRRRTLCRIPRGPGIPARTSAEAAGARAPLYRGHCERASQACQTYRSLDGDRQGVHELPVRARLRSTTLGYQRARGPRSPFGNSRPPTFLSDGRARATAPAPPLRARAENSAPEQQHLPQQQQQQFSCHSPRRDSALPVPRPTKTARRLKKHARRLQQLYRPYIPGHRGVRCRRSPNRSRQGGKSQRVASESGMAAARLQRRGGGDLY